MNAKRLRFSAGFTLLELIIGLAILGILMALAVPAFSDYLRNTRMRNYAESLNNGLRHARAEAIRRNTYVRFQLLDKMDATCAVVANTAAGANFWAISIGNPAGRCQKDLADPTPVQVSGTLPHDELGPDFTDESFVDADKAPFLLVKGASDSRQDEFQVRLGIFDQSNAATLPGTAVTPENVPVLCFSPSGHLARHYTDDIVPAGSDPRTRRKHNCGTSKDPGSTFVVAATIDIEPVAGVSPCTSAGGGSRCLRVEVRPGGDTRVCDRGVPTLNPAVPAGADPRGCSW